MSAFVEQIGALVLFVPKKILNNVQRSPTQNMIQIFEVEAFVPDLNRGFRGITRVLLQHCADSKSQQSFGI